MSNTALTIQIVDENVSIETHSMYGMRYPDGTVRWVNDQQVSFERLAEGDPAHSDRWENHMRSRAHNASINFPEYKAGHQLIKRTITVAVTAPEEV